MKHHKHLTPEQRYQISALLQTGISQSQIARSIGDFECDTVIGKGHKGVLVTLVDRATREIKIKALPNRKAEHVTQACISMLKEENTKSITLTMAKNLQGISAEYGDIFCQTVSLMGARN